MLNISAKLSAINDTYINIGTDLRLLFVHSSFVPSNNYGCVFQLATVECAEPPDLQTQTGQSRLEATEK